MAVLPTSVASGQSQKAVSPSDAADLPDGVCRTLYVNDQGVVTVAFIARDDADPLSRIVEGPCEILMSVRRVMATGTTALNIHAIY